MFTTKETCSIASSPRFFGLIPESTASSLKLEAQITTPQGGRHSYIGRSFHLMPAAALCQVAEVLYDGAKAKDEPESLEDSRDANWRRIAKHEHVNHALNHIFEYLTGDASENHLAHAACRLLFALEMAQGK